MAYKKQPVESTYDTKRVSFVSSLQQRSGSLPGKDARLVNVMVEAIPSPLTDSKKYFVKSRGGMSVAYTNTAGTGRGIYYWIISGSSYAMYVIGDKVYSNGTLLQTLATSTGEVGFTEFVSSTGTVSLILLDGTDGYVFSSPTLAPTKITDVDFPTPHLPFPIFLDGYLFVAKPNTQDIYNSNLDDPTKWTAGDFISAEMFPDTIVALSKNNNYIYAIGQSSVEYLYDAANATGSPLQRHDSAVQQFGCAAPGTVVQTEKEVIFIGETNNGGHTVWTIDGFKEKEIGTPAIKGALLAEGSSLASARAHCVRVSSQKLYIITLTARTLVYSFDTQMWHEWACGVDNSAVFLATYATDGPSGSAYLLGRSDGKVYLMNETKLDDAGTAFMCEITTPKLDFDNMNFKFASRLALIGDIPDSSGVLNNLTVDWSDDDYTTWVGNRTLSFNYDFPMIKQLGRFRRRAFRFRYSSAKLLRLEGFELDINKGTQ